jgi:16S rRNA (adenine1518-N6/adenine1519-N6)-dimethyltransferase
MTCNLQSEIKYNSIMDQAPESPVRQTQTYLRHLFQERGLRPKNKLGQNFLIDLNLIDFIVKNAELTRADMVLEVGTGTGSLTAALADQAGAVLTVEIDGSFHQLVQETLGHHAHVQFFHGDILKNKNHFNPHVMENLHEGLKRFGGKELKLVANLPYVVATPVISNLILSDLPVERMVVTVQWEIAERLMAQPGTKDYGALAILMQSLADIDLLRKLPPTVFWPRPKVDSAIIRIRPRAEKRATIGDPLRFRHFLRDLYAHRRKNLRGGLLSFPDKPWAKPEVDRKLAELGLDGNCRAETLDCKTHLRLCEVFGIFQSKFPTSSSNLW